MKYILIIFLIGTAFPSLFFLLAALDSGHFKSYILPIVLFLIPPVALITLVLKNWNNKTYQWIAVAYIILAAIVLVGMVVSTKKDKKAEIAALNSFADEKKGIYESGSSKISITGSGFNKNNFQYLSVSEMLDSQPLKDAQLFPRSGSGNSVFRETGGCSGREYIFETDGSLTINDLIESGEGAEWKCNTVNIGSFLKSKMD